MTPLCDLVLLSWNHPEVTGPCVASLLAHTTVPSRLIIVDQGSDEATRRLLTSLGSTPHVQVEILWNSSNVGFPRGMNQGLRRGSAPYVCFLNNDLLFPPGWLERLIAVLESDPAIGLVNPSSNTFDITPPRGDSWLEFAKACGRHGNRWLEVMYAEGFCILGRRQLLEELGGFDEVTYEQIYFEDADLSRRIQAKGLRCVMAYGTYVWHHGGQTMDRRPERQRLFQENQRRFEARWGKGRKLLYAVGSRTPSILDRVSEAARAEANRSGEIWIFAPASGAARLPRHLCIRVMPTPGWWLPWRALWKVLTKKKLVEGMVTDIGWLGAIFRLLRPFHRATVEILNLSDGPIAQ